jgi:hypothetical protein
VAATRDVAVGLHLTAGYAQDVYFDATKLGYREASTRIGVLGAPPVTSALVFHKTDGGRRDLSWKHSDFFLPANLGVGAPPNAVVEVAYYYSNRDLSVQSSTDRSDIQQNLSAYYTAAAIVGQPAGVGRYRYLVFDLSTQIGDADAVLWEYGTIQTTTQPIETGEKLTLVIGGKLAPWVIEFVRGSTVTLLLHYQTGPDPQAAPYDLTGGTVQVSLAKSSNVALAVGVPLVGPLSATITNALNGDASLTLGTVTAETDLPPGDYLLEVLMKKGTQRERHLSYARCLGAVTKATT